MYVGILQGKGKMAAGILRGLILAALSTVLLLLLLAFAMLKCRPLADRMELCILVTYGVSCFLGGFSCAHRAQRRKFLWGLLLGSLYFLILLLISGMGERSLQSGLLQGGAAFVLCACAGMLGGMLAG
jgi:putative membrane protein (TIGR04086 family)